MRFALWLMGVFAAAAALALFASSNDSTVTVYWPPYRLDLSLNLVLLVLGLLFTLLHLALRALAVLFAIPDQAHSWRIRHQERAMYSAMLDALLHWVAGRFLRAKKDAEIVLARESTLHSYSGDIWPDAARMRVLAHLLVAESAHSLQDTATRQGHLTQALDLATQQDIHVAREGLLLRAVRWSLSDHDATSALDLFMQLPGAVARRTVGLRLRLKVARMAGNTDLALETARLLAKHRALPEVSAQGLVRALALEMIARTYDHEQLVLIWQKLEASEQHVPEIACAAAAHLLALGGSGRTAFEWLLPIWNRMINAPDGLTLDQQVSLIRVLEDGFVSSTDTVDADWLQRIEHAQQTHPGHACLQYLAGVACLHLQLWGKAQQLLKAALPRLGNSELTGRAWMAVAELAHRAGDAPQAALAWKNAALRCLGQSAQPPSH